MTKIKKSTTKGLASRFFFKGNEYDIRQTNLGLQLYKENRFFRNLLTAENSDISIDDIINDLENLKNGETIYQLTEYVGTSTTGSITVPEEAAIFDLYGDGVLDAILVEADENGSPTEVNSLNSSGEIVLVDSLSVSGSYSLDSIPVENSCILYYIIIRDEYKDSVPLVSIIGAGIKGNLPIFTNSTITGSGSNISPIGIANLPELSEATAGQIMAVNDAVDGFKYSGVVSSNPIQLKAISKVNQPIADNPSFTVIDAEVTQESNGITISNGVVTINKSGFFRIQVQLSFSNAANTHLDTWVEYWDGDSWEILTDSGNHYSTSSSADIGQFLIESTLTVTEGAQLRLVADTSSGSAELNFVSGTSVDNPSVTFIAYEINPIVVGISKETNNITEDFHIGQEAAGNSTVFEEDGTWQNKGDSTVWDDVVNSLIGRRLYSNAGTIDYDYTENALILSSNGGIDNVNDRIVFNLQYPHSAKENGTMNLHVHWIQEDTTERAFTIQYRVQNNGSEKTATWTEITSTSTLNNVYPYVSGELNQITKIVDIDMTGASLSATVQFRFTRSDSNAGTILATFIDAHVERDMNGSREEFLK